MCQAEFEKRWVNGGCGGSVGSDIAAAAGTGFVQGAGDGTTLAVNNLTLGCGNAEEAAEIRAANDGNTYYLLGDLSSKIGAFAAHTAALSGISHNSKIIAFGRGPVTVFWTGGVPASTAATAWATTNGGRTLAMTEWQFLGTTRGAWAEASECLASEATGTAHVFVNSRMTAEAFWGSYFARLEWPILQARDIPVICHCVP